MKAICIGHRTRTLVFCLGLFVLTATQTVVAQDPPVIPVTPTPVDPGNGGVDVPGSTGGGGGTSDGNVEPTVLELGGDIEDTRNQGFVGATATAIQERGFVGATSETSGPALSDGATFGGGVNGTGTQAGGGGQAGGFGGGGNGFGGFNGGFGGQGLGTGGTLNGFQVVRQNLRTNLVPRFYSPTVGGGQTAIRFQQRIALQPVPVSSASAIESPQTGVANTVQVMIENRTATLVGRAATTEQRDRWERQLRLEPGVDRIVNLIEVWQTAGP